MMKLGARHQIKGTIAALAALLLLAAPAAFAQSPTLTIFGRVGQPQTYTREALAALPALEVTGAVQGTNTASFVGTPLWPLIDAAGPVDGPERGSRLQHVIIARGADGYAVALAQGELDPNFEAKPVLVAYKQDGVLLPALRLVVPGDKHAGRNVRELVSIELR